MSSMTPRALALGLREGALFSSLAAFLSPFPRPTWFLFCLVSILDHAVGVQLLEVRGYDSILATSVTTHPLKLGFGFQP